MKFSASMLKTYGNCQLQGKFAYMDKLPQKQSASATFGTCVHEALEQYNEHRDIDAAVKRFLYTWENPEALGVSPDFWHRRVTYGGLQETGVKAIMEYHESNVWADREMIAAEHKFCVPFGDRHLLSGIVDMLESPRGSSELRVCDFKTAGSRPNADMLYLDLQFTTYYYASLQPEFWLGFDDGSEASKNSDGSPRYPPMENGEELYERFKGADRKVIWYHLRQNKELDCGPRDDGDFMRLMRCCDEIEKAVNHDIFVPSISGNSCTFCSYTDICKAYVPPPIDTYDSF
jgi:hypothetical protein